jgi:hypothetical protein
MPYIIFSLFLSSGYREAKLRQRNPEETKIFFREVTRDQERVPDKPSAIKIGEKL